MRRVDRSSVAVPISLQPGGRGEVELVSARAYYAQQPAPKKAFKFRAYKEPDVGAALNLLFHGKCAYCESFFAATQPVDIEHFRPKAGIDECPNHPGYWWLAMVWENLLPSCIDCNRRRTQVVLPHAMTLKEAETAFATASGQLAGKENSFPTKDGFWCSPEDDPTNVEQTLLIDPTRSDPDMHMSWDLEKDLPIAVPVNLSSEGTASIRVFALNRYSLVQARHKRLIDLRVATELIESMLDALEGMSDEQQAKQVAKIVAFAKRLDGWAAANAPYSSMAKKFIFEFRKKLQVELDQYMGAPA